MVLCLECNISPCAHRSLFRHAHSNLAIAQESIILVRWLAGVCWDVAVKTGSHHDHLRAAVFVGLDQLRDTFAQAIGPPSSEELEKAEFFKDLYQAALLGALASMI